MISRRMSKRVSISESRPITGSICPSEASCVRLRPSEVRSGNARRSSSNGEDASSRCSIANFSATASSRGLCVSDFVVTGVAEMTRALGRCVLRGATVCVVVVGDWRGAGLLSASVRGRLRVAVDVALPKIDDALRARVPPRPSFCASSCSTLRAGVPDCVMQRCAAERDSFINAQSRCDPFGIFSPRPCAVFRARSREMLRAVFGSSPIPFSAERRALS